MFPYIKKIWHSLLVLALAVVFSYFAFFLYFHPLNLVFFLGDKLSAATGTADTATVPVNPINQLAMQLDAKQAQLNQQEQSLNARQAQLNSQENIWNSGLLLSIFLALAILAVLIIVNFYFDRRREKELEILAQLETKETLVKEEKNPE